MDNIYIARKFSIMSEYNFKAYYNESVFTSYIDAEHFIKKECLEDSSNFFSEILHYPLGKNIFNSTNHIWYFDNNGNLIHTTNLSDDEIKAFNKAYTTLRLKFNIGDFVFIEAFPKNKYHCLWKDIIGFIAHVPIPLKIWTLKGGKEEEWDCCYVIYFINSNGHLDHVHAPEISIQPYTNNITDKLSFLKTYSDVIKNNISVNDDYNSEIWSGKIYLKHIELFDKNKLIKQ